MACKSSVTDVTYKRRTFHSIIIARAWKNMVEESDAQKPTSPEKLSIDDSTNFQFHVAYSAYSDIYDKVTDPEKRKKLNENIMALRQNQMDYQTFYESIDQFRGGGDVPQHGYGRAFIKTQKKRDWRRKTQKHERIQRHRK